MKKGSVILCTVFVIFFLAVLAGLCLFMPLLLRTLCRFSPLLNRNVPVVLCAFYACVPPTALALSCLLLLLRTIRIGRSFSRQSIRLMGWISWCCLAVAAVCAVAALRYYPLALIAVAMLFIFLIVRIVRMSFLAAIELQEENSLTI